jgi:hypothetical protein
MLQPLQSWLNAWKLLETRGFSPISALAMEAWKNEKGSAGLALPFRCPPGEGRFLEYFPG